MGTRSSRGTTETNGNGGDHSHGDVTLDVFGVTLLLTKDKKLVLPDGRKPRRSFNDDGGIIPGHFPFLAVESGSYQVYGPNGAKVKPVMSFSYDLDGAGIKTDLDAFMLDGHVVRISDIEEGKGDINPRNIPRMRTLAKRLELCPAVPEESRQVVAYVDLSNAKSVEGMDHGAHSEHPLRFGTTVSNAAEKLTAKFAVSHDKPKVSLTRRKVNEKTGDDDDGQNAFTIELKGPARLMVGNVPAEEVMDLNTLPEGEEIPLTHIELLYDLYHGAPAVPPVPRCTHHVVQPGGAHPHTAGGHCGPPMQEEGGP